VTTEFFDDVCEQLGYEPASVLSIRINRSKVVVTHADEQGDLHSTVLLLPGVQGRPADPAPGTRPRGGSGTSTRLPP
jgi:hypothetical protein